MAIYFLDVDDEITSAAKRIRDSSDTRIALVLSGGSRVATSRINFRLLAREAQQRHKRLAIVAPDQSVRSVAQSAGLPVFATVGEYEKSEALRATAGVAGAGETSAALDELAATIKPGATPPRQRAWSPPAHDPVAGATDGFGPGVPRAASRVVGASGSVLAESTDTHASGPARQPSRGPRTAVAVLAILALVAGAAGVAIFWPSARVVLTLAEVPVGPVSLTVKVDPSATSSNDATATVPAVTKAFPVTSQASFNATGQNVVDTAATGSVTFSTISTIQSVPVIAGTQVSTRGGVAFTTTQTVTIPRATVSGTTITLGRATAPIVAVKKGLAGNVAKGLISKVPSDLAAFGVSVDNIAATSGGLHTVTPAIAQSDIDSAEATLLLQLNDAFRARVADPSSAPAGYQLFENTARLGEATFSPDPASLLNQGVASFDLGATATGTATVADLLNVQNLAERRVKAQIKSGYSIVSGSVSALFGNATAAGSTLSVPVTARATQVATVDPAALRVAIEGMSVEDAKAYLAKYGKVDISLSPGWGGMPGFDFRIDLQIVVPASHPTNTPIPRPGGGATPPPVNQTHKATEPPATGSSVPSGSASPRPSGSASPSSPVGGSPTATITAGPSASPPPTAGLTGGPSPTAT